MPVEYGEHKCGFDKLANVTTGTTAKTQPDSYPADADIAGS